MTSPSRLGRAMAVAISAGLAPSAWAQDSGAAEPVVLAASALPRDLSTGMFLGADIVVQAVMVGLAIASVVTWTV